MSEVRNLTCGQPTGMSGYPCMRVSGHSGPCMPGIAMATDHFEGEGITAAPPGRKMNLYGIPKRLIMLGILSWLIVAFQVWVDVRVIFHAP